MIEQHSYSGAYTNRYKFNGKELDEETGYYYYGARYYNPKFSIWLSVDPLAELFPHITPYNYCYQNPIMFKDKNGMNAEGEDPIKIPNLGTTECVFSSGNTGGKSPSSGSSSSQSSSSKYNSNRAPSMTFSHGGAFGPMGGSAKNTSIMAITGNNPGYYNSNPYPDYFEQNHFTQIAFRLGKNSRNEFVINIFKEKMRPFDNGYRDEAGTSFEFGLGKYYGGLLNFGKFSLSSDFSASFGPHFAVPTFAGDANGVPLGTAYASGFHLPLGGGDYYITGMGASFITRVNLNYRFLSVFLAGTVHYWQSFNQPTSVGTMPSQGFGSVGGYIGTTINFGCRNK